MMGRKTPPRAEGYARKGLPDIKRASALLAASKREAIERQQALPEVTSVNSFMQERASWRKAGV
jgi:hypothetical protein